MSKITYIKNRDSLTFYVDGKLTVIPQTHVNYTNILDALDAGDMNAVRPLLQDVRTYIASKLSGSIKYDGANLTFEGEPIRLSLADRIVDLIRNGFDVTPLSNFLRNLLDNPSPRAREEAFDFLEVNDCPITADGHVIAYKMVRSDFRDIYTGTMDNSPGSLVKMDREEVDPDKDNTCSDGLHFAGLHYVLNGNYGSRGSGHKLVAVKINPRDIVAIPSDYKRAKGRASQYVILRELDWTERLPINHTGFKLLTDTTGEPADEEAVESTVEAVGDEPETAMTLAVRTGYTVDDVRKAKRMMQEPGFILSNVSRETGINRRQLARIRDGEVYADILP